MTESKHHKSDAKRLRLLREHLALSRERFAKWLRVSPGTLANYEKAKTAIPLRVSRKIKRRYGVDVTPPNPNTNPERVVLDLKRQVRSEVGIGGPNLPLDELGESDPLDELRNSEAVRKTLKGRLAELQSKHDFLHDVIYSPLRRRISKGFAFVYYMATFTYGTEHIRRTLEHETPEIGAYRDILYGASLLTLLIAGAGCLLSLPWGLRLEKLSESRG